MNTNGIITRKSPYPVKETINRLEEFLLQHGATVYARIDQQAEVNKAGADLLPLEFILFGNPKAGGPIMAANPLAALDLPLKVIAWQDAQQQVWVAYNEAGYIKDRFALRDDLIAPLNLDPVILKTLA